MKRLLVAAMAGALVLASRVPAFANKSNDTIVWTTAVALPTASLYYDNVRGLVITTLNMCDGLVHYDTQTKKYLPNLASSYNWVNPTTLDIELRHDVSFWNGQSLTSKDVAYTLNFIRNPNHHAKVELYDWIKDIKILGKYELQIIAKKPTPAAIAYLADETAIYPDGLYDHAPTMKVTGGKVVKDYASVRPICTGPYMLTNFVPGQTFTLTKNPNYFKGGPKGQPHIGKLVFKTIPNTTAQLAALKTGKVDWIWSVLPQNKELLANDHKLTVKQAGTIRIAFLSLDVAGRTGPNPLQNLKVRRAMAYAINQAAIVDNLVPGGKVLKSMCAPGLVGCTGDVPQYPYDPGKAKKLLAEAGYPNGLHMTMYAYRDPQYVNAVRNYLRQVGIKTDLQFRQWSALAPITADGKVRLGMYTWGGQGIFDASADLDRYFTFGAEDYTRDSALRDLVEAGDHEINPSKRDELYKKALTIVAEKAYAIPLFTYGRIYAFDSDLDYQVTDDGLAHFYAARWKK